MQAVKYGGESLKYIHGKVNCLLLDASAYQGYAFGGYVRDVIPKILLHNFIEIAIKDVDIWFKSEPARDRFLSDYPCLRKIASETSFADSVTYSYIDEYGDHLFPIDCIVSEQFPGNDFDVNMLCWNPRDKCFFCPAPDMDLTDIFRAIREKKATMTDSYYQEIRPHEEKRVIYRFMNKGWTVYHDYREMVVGKNETIKYK